MTIGADERKPWFVGDIDNGQQRQGLVIDDDGKEETLMTRMWLRKAARARRRTRQ